uniref:Multiprotein bridging factor 1 N-terminal domain-containing protein n=1 Tax=Zea mays TaxID=4577 RepID=A0A804NM20_MAIZE
MAGIGPIRQDWEPVVVRKKAPTAAAKKDEKAVNAARRSGAEIETMKKFNAGMNKAASSGTSLNTKRLDDDTENLAREQSSVSGHFSHEQSDRRFFVPRIPIDKFGHLSTVDVINDLYMFMFTSLAVDDVFF